MLNLDAARRPDPTDCPPSQAMRYLPSHQQRKVAKRAKFLDKIRVASLSATKRSPSAKKRKSAKGLSASSLDFATLSATHAMPGPVPPQQPLLLRRVRLRASFWSSDMRGRGGDGGGPTPQFGMSFDSSTRPASPNTNSPCSAWYSSLRHTQPSDARPTHTAPGRPVTESGQPP